MRKVFIVVLFLALGALLLAVMAAGEGTKVAAGVGVVTPEKRARTTRRAVDPPGTVRGAENPDAIPDLTAYSLLFRFIANRQGEELKNIRAYVRHMGLGKQPSAKCPLSNEPNHRCSLPSVGASDDDIDVLLALADAVHQKVSVLDKQVKEIKDRTWPNPDEGTLDELRELQQQKDAIVVEAAASLKNKLSAEAEGRLRVYLRERVKRGTKIIPADGPVERQSEGFAPHGRH